MLHDMPRRAKVANWATDPRQHWPITEPQRQRAASVGSIVRRGRDRRISERFPRSGMSKTPTTSRHGTAGETLLVGETRAALATCTIGRKVSTCGVDRSSAGSPCDDRRDNPTDLGGLQVTHSAGSSVHRWRCRSPCRPRCPCPRTRGAARAADAHCPQCRWECIRCRRTTRHARRHRRRRPGFLLLRRRRTHRPITRGRRVADHLPRRSEEQ